MSQRPRPASKEHLQRVQSLTDAALAHLTVERLLDELLIRVRELMNVDTAAVLLIDPGRNELIATAAKGIEEEVEQGVRLPVGAGFAGTIAARGEPVILDEVDHTKVLNPLLLRRGIRSMLGVPLIASGTIVGVLHVGTLHHHTFTEEDVELLQLVADRAALAVDVRRHQQDRFIAETLQRSLLPDRFPRTPGIEISGLYAPAGGGMVGGDWYDVFSLPDGRLCLTVGDTVGSGVQAATAMARLRDAVRALVFVDASTSRAMTHLNDLIRHFDPGLMATAFIGFLSPEGRLTYSNAGHLPPLNVSDGDTSLLEELREPALGVAYYAYSETTFDLPSGSSLLVYTDGLVERRGRPLEEGLDRLRTQALTGWPSLEDLCRRVLETDVLETELTDDLAVILLRRVPLPGAAVVATFPADPRQLAPLRRQLRRWIADNQIAEQDAADLLLAVGEATANAIEHAYGPGRGDVHVEVSREQQKIKASVRDSGRWREPRGRDRGRGRLLIEASMDEVRFESDEAGTRVEMWKELKT